MARERDRIAHDSSAQLVLIPALNVRYPATFAPHRDDLDALRRFIVDRLAQVDRFVEDRDDEDMQVRIPVVLNLVPRPDNSYTQAFQDLNFVDVC